MGADLKFIHCSDLHLGSRFTGISEVSPELGRRLRGSILRSFQRIVDLAIDEKADLMVISGDVFDEENESPSTKYSFVKELERLSIPCFISLGNHDHKHSWDASIPYPSNVHVFSDRSESIIIDMPGGNAEITGISFPSRHTTENLAASLKGSVDAFTIGVVHCSLDSTSEDDRYAPCRLSDLLGKNIDYWALGHIHKRIEVYSRPHIVYPGNIQGRNKKESGEKGAYVVSVRNGSVSDTKFVPTQDILWQDITVDITGKDYNLLIKEISDSSKRSSIISLILTGKGDLDPAIRLDTKGFIDTLSAATDCTISSLDIRTYPSIDLSSLEENDLMSKIADSAGSLKGLSREEIIDQICSTRMSSEIRYIFDRMTDDELHSMVTDAEMLLIDMLRGGSQ